MNSAIEQDELVNSVLALVDKALKDNSGKQMVPVSDTADILLDIRGLVSMMIKEVHK